MKELPRQIIILEGPSGCGKTSLARALKNVSRGNAQVVKPTGHFSTKDFNVSATAAYLLDSRRIDTAIQYLMNPISVIKTVILDRCLLSGLVYEALRKGTSHPKISALDIAKIFRAASMRYNTIVSAGEASIKPFPPLYVHFFIFNRYLDFDSFNMMRVKQAPHQKRWDLSRELTLYQELFETINEAPIKISIGHPFVRIQIQPIIHSSVHFEVKQVVEGVKSCRVII